MTPSSEDASADAAGQLESRVAERTRELLALYEISRDISSRLDINAILRSVTDKARELLGGDMSAMCLLDGTGQVLNLRSVSGSKAAVVGDHLPAANPPAQWVLATDRAQLCGVENCLGACGMLAAPFRVSHLAAPLRVGDRVIGALCVGSQRAAAFSDEAADLLTKLADSVAIALENARLYERAERVAMLEERQRIASDMHDGVAQTLSYLGLKAREAAELARAGRSQQAADVLQRVCDAIAQASRETRQAIAALQEDATPRRDLQAQLADLAGESSAHGGSVSLALQPPPLFLPLAQNEQVLRVVREALQNARRHANARHIAIYLDQRAAEATLRVEDDGCGFDPDAPARDGGGHFGLSIMRARAARLGGRLTVQSAIGRGTQVVLTWPLQLADSEELPTLTEGWRA